MKVTLTSQLDQRQPQDVLVVFSHKNKGDEKQKAKLNHAELAKELSAALSDDLITGKAQEVVLFREKNLLNCRHILVVGLGSQWSGEGMRQSGAVVWNALQSLKPSKVSVELGGILGSQSTGNLQAFAEGLGLAGYEFDELKSNKKENKKEIHLQLITKESKNLKSKKALMDAEILVECVNFSRRLGDMPGNLMTPSDLAEEVQRFAKGTKAKCTIWDEARIKKEKMGGLWGVAQGSAQPPRFIIVEYKGASAKEKPAVFVGKGLTFDTGGISIKPSAAMEEMKYDMCGGANVLGAVLAMAKLKLKVNAIALVPATENMPGSRATKPGDIHTARNGKTFEVNNTDAEGRLILSDALCYGSELKPKWMVDAATLTGAMVVALGNTHTGFFTRNNALAKKIEKAAEVSGEWVWRMPLVDHHVSDMKGTFADLSNISSSKGAGSATAAAFLEQFVDKDIPWAHFDIAGTAWAVGNRLPYCSKKGASGCMIRTFVELAKV